MKKLRVVQESIEAAKVVREKSPVVKRSGKVKKKGSKNSGKREEF